MDVVLGCVGVCICACVCIARMQGEMFSYESGCWRTGWDGHGSEMNCCILGVHVDRIHRDRDSGAGAGYMVCDPASDVDVRGRVDGARHDIV